jgi:[ribosomal protein S5]-alanine N-acetyltransferase
MVKPQPGNDLEYVVRHADNINITKYMSDGFPDSLDKWKSFITSTVDHKSILYLAIDIDGQAVGSIGISPQKDVWRRNAVLGYWLQEKYWGRGIMTKAIIEVVKRAFATFDIDRIYATPFGTNLASHRVLEKAGFTLEAKFEKTVIKNGELLDEMVYAIRKKNIPVDLT